MAKPMTEAEIKRLNHNQYSAWIQWRCIIDPETAAWIMQNMGDDIAVLRLRHADGDSV